MIWKSIAAFTLTIYCRLEEDELTALGAQTTYYFILSFFPFLLVLITLLGYMPVVTVDAIKDWLMILPDSVYAIVVDIIDQIIQERNEAFISIGTIAALWTASNGIEAIVKGLNKAYDEKERRAYWKVKGLSILYTFAIIVVILCTLFIVVFGHDFGQRMSIWLDIPRYYEQVWGIFKYGIPLVVIGIVFMCLYRFMPNRKLTFRAVLPGALFTTLGWLLTTMVFSYYVNQFSNYSKTYGSIGGVIVLLLWLYLSSIIILVGGEINALFTFRKEGRNKKRCKPFGEKFNYDFAYGKESNEQEK